jgi:hypothetical protein
VIVPSRAAEHLEALRATINTDYGGRLVTIVGDLSDETDAVRLQQHLKAHQPVHGAAGSQSHFASPAIASAGAFTSVLRSEHIIWPSRDPGTIGVRSE